jgi:hypothetical protein
MIGLAGLGFRGIRYLHSGRNDTIKLNPTNYYDAERQLTSQAIIVLNQRGLTIPFQRF